MDGGYHFFIDSMLDKAAVDCEAKNNGMLFID